MNPKLALEKMKAIYRSPAYWNEMSYGVYLASEHIRLKNALRNWRFASRFLPQSGRLLDIGCATGFFGAVAHQHAYEVVGIDPAEELVDFGRRKYGLDLRISTLEKLSSTRPASTLSALGHRLISMMFGQGSKIADWLRPGTFFSAIRTTDIGYVSFSTNQQAANVYYNLSVSCHHLMRQLGLISLPSGRPFRPRS
jgi:SAM-dependent methyltransferase